MLGVSDIKSFVEMLRMGRTSWRARRHPQRLQASRILAAFAAHDIAPTQIQWVLPETLNIPSSAWGYPDDLAPHISKELLTWVADYLAIRLQWLIGVDEEPREIFRLGYKPPQRWFEFLSELQTLNPDSQWALLVFKADAKPLAPTNDEPFVVVLEELFGELHGEPLCRYYQCSEGWSMGHPPCVLSLMEHCAIALQLDCYVRGHALPAAELKRLDAGEGLIPELTRKRSGLWHPDDILPNAKLARIAGFEHYYPKLHAALQTVPLPRLAELFDATE